MPTLDDLAAEAQAPAPVAPAAGLSLDHLAAEADLDQQFEREDADREAIGLPRMSQEQRAVTRRRLLPAPAAPAAPAAMGSPAGELPPDHSLGAMAKSYAQVPGQVLSGGLVETAAGLGHVPDILGLPKEAARPGTITASDLFDYFRRQHARDAHESLRNAPGAETTANLGASLLPFTAGPLGVAAGAGAMGGNKYQEMRDRGATEGQARAAGAGMAAVGAALPALGRVVAPVAEATGGALARTVAPVTGQGAAEVAGRLASGAVEGEAANLALMAANAGGTALHSLDDAEAEALAQLKDPTLALLGAAGRGAGAVPGLVRSARDAVTGRPTAEVNQAAIAAQRPENARVYLEPNQQAPGGDRTSTIPQPNTPPVSWQEAKAAAGIEDIADGQARSQGAEILRRQEDEAIRSAAISEQARNDAEQQRRDEQAQVDLEQEQARQGEQERAQAILADQERVRAENADREARRDAFLLREDLKLRQESGSVYGSHRYDESGRLVLDPDAPNRAATEVGLQRAQELVRRHLGDDEGAFATDDPTLAPGVAEHRMTTKPLPAETAAGVRRGERPAAAPTVEQLLAMPGEARAQALRRLPAAIRQPLVAEMVAARRARGERSIEEGQIHGFRDPAPAAPRPIVPRSTESATPAPKTSSRPAEPVAAPRSTHQPVQSIADVHRGFREVYGLKPEEATVATALVRARAAALGVDADTFARERIGEIRSGKGSPSLNQKGQAAPLLQEGVRIIPRDQSLAFEHLTRQWRKAHGDRTPVRGSQEWMDLQRKASVIDQRRGILYQEDVASLNDARATDGKKIEKGAISFAEDGRAVIHALKAPDVSTAVHELGHLFRRTMNERQQEIAGRWAGAKDGQWSRAAEEKFARGFERYLRDGSAPFEGMRKIFQQMATWMRTIYQHLRGSPVDIEISPEVRRLFDELLTPKDKAEAAKFEAGMAKDRAGEVEPSSIAAPAAKTVPAAAAIVPSKPAEGTKQGTIPPVEEKPAAAPKSSTPKPEPLKKEAPGRRSTVEDRAAAEQTKPELANPGLNARSRELVSAARAKMEPPERKAQEQSIAEGRRLLEDSGRTSALRAKVKSGVPLSDAETAAYVHLLDRESGAAIAQGGSALARVIDEIQGYTRGGTEQARALAMRRDQLLTPEERAKAAVTRAILMPSANDAAAISRIRDQMQDATPIVRGKLQRKLDEMTASEVRRVESFKRRMTGMGFDLEHLDLLYQNEGKAAALVDEARISKADHWDKQYEWWISSILSGLKTQITNISGNVLNFVSHYGLEKPLQTILGKIPGLGGGGPSVHELGHVYRALLSGETWRFAGRHFLDTWSTERPMLDAEMGAGRALTRAQAILESSAGSKFMGHAPLNQGLASRALRTVSLRSIQAVDQFFKSLGARAEVAGEAYRRARETGLDPKSPEFQEFIRQELDDLGSSSWAGAFKTAKDLTFQRDPGAITQAVTGLRNKIPGARYIVPFIPTLVNLMGRGMQMAPLTGQLNMARKIAQHGLWMAKPGARGANHYARQQVVQDLAAQVSGLVAASVIAQWANEGPDGLPNLTGTEDRFIAAKDQTVPAKSIRIGGKYYSYDRLDPFSTIFATTADLLSIYRATSTKDALATAASNLRYQVLDKSFMSTLNDMDKAISGGGGGTNTAAKIGRGILVGFIPNVIRQPLGAGQDEAKDQAVYARPDAASGLWWKEQARIMAGQAVGGLPFLPKVDLWGKDVAKDTPKLGSDFLWRALSPVATQPGQASNAYEQALYNWNKTAEKPLWPSYPKNYIDRKDGSRWYFDSKSYNDMLRDRGQRTLAILGDWRPADPVHPSEVEVKRIQRAIGDAHEMAMRPYRNEAKARAP